MLGVGLRKLCPMDSFGYAFRMRKTVRKSIPGGCKTGPWGIQNRLREASGRLFCASRRPIWPPRPLGSRLWAALGALLGRFWRSWSRLGAFWAAPGASRDFQGLIWTIWTMSMALREIQQQKHCILVFLGLQSLLEGSESVPKSALEVSWDQRSVWRAQVELHKGQVEVPRAV